METMFTSIINRQADIEVLEDRDFYVDKVVVNWNLEILKTVSKANLRINIVLVEVYGTEISSDKPIAIEFHAENCEVIKGDTTIFDDVFPVLAEINTHRDKVKISF